MRRSVELDGVLAALPPSVMGLLEPILGVAEHKSIPLYLVGGPVRDFLLERQVRDVDLVVEARNGIDAATLAKEAAPPDARLVVHERFGTVSFERDGTTLDLGTARRESYAHPGALPRVEVGSLEEDLRRRDFSVNALAIPLCGDVDPRRLPILDVEDGLADLAAGRLRVLHARSFHDDPTRGLRAARLAPRLGFTLTRATRSALRGALRDGAFGAVSGERLRAEIRKIFEDTALGLDPSAAFRALAEWHVLAALEPGLELPRESLVPLRRLGRSLVSPPWRFGRFRPWACGLYVWLAPLPSGLRRRALRRLTVRGELAERIAHFPKLRDTSLARLAAARGRGAADRVLSPLDEEQLLAVYTSAPATVQRRIVRWAAEDRARRAPISGADLLEFGLSGPAVGRVLASVRTAHLDGGVANREEAIALARELARRATSRERQPRKSARKGTRKGTGKRTPRS